MRARLDAGAAPAETADGTGDDAAALVVALLAPVVEDLAAELRARAAADGAPTAPLSRDDRLILEGLAAYRARAAEQGLAWPPAGGASLDGYPRCWFGVSSEDGLPWMYCLNQRTARELLDLAERLVAAGAGQGTT